MINQNPSNSVSSGSIMRLVLITGVTVLVGGFGLITLTTLGHRGAAPTNNSGGSMNGMNMAITPTSTDGMSAMAMNSATAAPTVAGVPGLAMGSATMAATTDAMSGMSMNNGGNLPPLSSLPQAQMSGVTQMNGLVMPPGMIMDPGMSAASMADMAAVDPTTATYTAPTDAQGDQALTPTITDGVKIFNLDVSIIKWNILPNVQVMAYTFNQQIPGPRIHLTQGDHVRIIVKNDLPEATSVHWHGLDVPNQADGAGNITQKPIAPGESYTYEFTINQFGTYMYHSHLDSDRQQALGMYGALIIDPKDPINQIAADQDVLVQLQEWTVKQGYTFPSMPMEGLLPNYFTINGKSFPATSTINVKVGQKIHFRFLGTNTSFIHPMHIHGGPFTIVAIDGSPVPLAAQLQRDTVEVGPGERYDVIWTARQPGKWLLHCHIPHHTTNNNVEEQGGGGLTMVINAVP